MRRFRLHPLARVTGFALVLAACGRGEAGRSALPSGSTASSRLSDSVVHLPSGDSVEFQATGSAVVPDGPPGVLVTYFPFGGLSDTARASGVAREFFRVLRPRVAAAPFVAMQAVDVRAADRRRPGAYPMHTFGVVVERHADGRWYRMGDATPVAE